MSDNQEIKQDYKNFTPIMAFVDMIPVLLFGTSCILVGIKFHSILFIAGAVLCLLAGTGKVTWKFNVAFRNKDIAFLNFQFRILMPIGFSFFIASIFLNNSSIPEIDYLVQRLTSFPGLLFFIAAGVLLAALMVMAFTLDRKNSRANWAEQIVNCLAQLMFLLGIIFVF